MVTNSIAIKIKLENTSVKVTKKAFYQKDRHDSIYKIATAQGDDQQ